MQLFGGQDEGLDQRPVGQGLVVAAVPIVLIDLKQEQLDEPFRTEEDVAGPELTDRYAIFLHVLHHIQQTAHDV